ncbi:glycosyltransferase family 2 protein [Ruegeria sp. 6PALISEP08]|uniref:glycosyltransferase family 2 protein n=1 Tax=Ruegeria sp. 6PALISEP08 TaxID=1225660 RepID=UPI000A512217|nr:glycosyltransferase family 2 protein [Ruegeria sp. 6PALISEP08]
MDKPEKILITAMKNEGPYILEWVAHHKVLGFDRIIVYTNDCSDGTNQILRRLQDMGHVEFHKNRVGTGGIHRSALRQARRLPVVKEAKWIYVGDADEFLNIHVGNHKVDDLIEATPGVDVVSIPWKIFSNSGRHVLRDKPVTQQFFDAELDYEHGGAGRRFVKSLFRQGELYLRFGLHNPHPKPEFQAAMFRSVPGGHAKEPAPFGNHVSPPFGLEVAQINHYAVRSTQAYLAKRSRGRANHSSQTLGTDYWDRWNRGGATDETILRYKDEVDAVLEEFRSDDRLKRLHRKSFRWHKALINELLKQPDYHELYQKLLATPAVEFVGKDRIVRERLSTETIHTTGEQQPES